MVGEQTGSPGGEAESSLSAEDRRILTGVDSALAAARDLERWWRSVDAGGAYRERFELSATHNRPDSSFGFFDQAEVGDETMPIMGVVQEQIYDRPKAADPSVGKPQAAWIDRQIREFVLRYFLRVSAFRRPEALAGGGDGTFQSYLRPLRWAPFDQEPEVGPGFEQVFYKERGAPAPAKFGEEARHAIVDLRQLGERYEWIVVRVEIFEHAFTLEPFGHGRGQGPTLAAEPSWVILSPDFVLDRRGGEGAGELGRYGFGFGLLPVAEERLVAVGPGRFEAAFQAVHFRVGEGGEVSSRLAFIAERPKKMVDVSVDPVSWSLRLADMLSFGAASPILEPVQRMWNRVPHPGGVDLAQAYLVMARLLTGAMANGGAARGLGVSKKQLDKSALASHCAQQYNLIAGSLMTWRQIPDWLDRESLPAWVVSGRTAEASGR